MKGLKLRRIGASGKSYTATVPKGSKVVVATHEHGYSLKATVLLNFNAMTESQAAKAHTLLFAALTEALADAAAGRRMNVPMFDLSDLETRDHTEGVNTL